MHASKPIQRSVESLQRIYTFVVALSIATAINATFIADGQLTFTAAYLPVFIAFAVTVVPFFHGMNRHLDRCYIERHDPHVQGALLFDFVVFFVEAGLLVALAASVQSGLLGFVLLAVILSIDIGWGVISHLIHYRGVPSGTIRWVVVNVLAVVLLILVYLLDLYAPAAKAWVLATIAVVRTILDYVFAWTFYFPPRDAASDAHSEVPDLT